MLQPAFTVYAPVRHMLHVIENMWLDHFPLVLQDQCNQDRSLFGRSSRIHIFSFPLVKVTATKTVPCLEEVVESLQPNLALTMKVVTIVLLV